MGRNGEAWLLTRLAPHLRTVIDVGANQGNWMACALRARPDIEAICVEAIPESAEALIQRFGDRVRVIPVALSDAPKTLALYKVGGGGKAGLAGTKKRWEELHLETETGDRILESLGLDEVSMIKIDVDGFDLPVLRGFENTIDRFRPVIQFEYSRYWIDSRCYLSDAFAYFEARAFRVGRLMPKRIDFLNYAPEQENFLTCNFVALPEEETPHLGL